MLMPSTSEKNIQDKFFLGKLSSLDSWQCQFLFGFPTVYVPVFQCRFKKGLL